MHPHKICVPMKEMEIDKYGDVFTKTRRMLWMY